MKQALLVLVSGPATARPGLASRIAGEMALPLLTRESVRAGLVETQQGWTVTPAGELAARATALWQEAVRGLVEAGVTMVTEHPLRAEVTRADVERLAGDHRIKLVHCQLAASTRQAPPPPELRLRPMRTGGMIVERPDRRGPEPHRRDLSSVLGVPVLRVEKTARAYQPPLADIVWFLRQPS